MLYRRHLSYVLIPALLAQTFGGSALAQTGARGGVVTPAFGAPIFTGQPGTYQINSQNTTQLLNQAFTQIAGIQQSDKEYLDQTVKSIDQSYNELVNLIVVKLNQLSQQTIATQAPVQVESYFDLINQINEKSLAVESRITSLTEAANGALPSVTAAEVAGQKINVPNFRGNMNFQRLIGFYQGRIKDLLAKANDLPMSVVFKSGVRELINIGDQASHDLLTHKFKIPPYSPDEVAKMQKDIQKFRTPPFQLDDTMNDQAKQLRNLIQTFVVNYGLNEKYRFHDQSYRTQRADAFKTIVDMFWQRSYIRAKYGVRLGALQPADYKKRKLNIDKFTVTVDTLRTFREERAETEADLMNSAESMRMILKVVDARSVSILDKNPNVAVLDRANALVAFLKGDVPSAESLAMVMKLVAADIKEEQMLTIGGGRAKVFEFYKNRYQGTADNKTYYKTLKCGYDSLVASTSPDCKDTAHADVVTNSGGGLRVTFNNLNQGLFGMIASLNQANQLEQQVMVSVMSNGGVLAQKLQKETDDL